MTCATSTFNTELVYAPRGKAVAGTILHQHTLLSLPCRHCHGHVDVKWRNLQNRIKGNDQANDGEPITCAQCQHEHVLSDIDWIVIQCVLERCGFCTHEPERA